MERGSSRPTGEISLQEKVAFLRQPSSFPDSPHRVEAHQTRMSWVFLTDCFVYKLKKPVTTPHVDLASPAQRRCNCEIEVRLNARLAPGNYLGIVPLLLDLGGRLRLGGNGEPIDWLVCMRRLPERDMLDTKICSGTLQSAEITAVADQLCAFYAAAEPVSLAQADYLGRFGEEQAATRQVLHDPRLALPARMVEAVLAPVDTMLRQEPGPRRASCRGSDRGGSWRFATGAHLSRPAAGGDRLPGVQPAIAVARPVRGVRVPGHGVRGPRG